MHVLYLFLDCCFIPMKSIPTFTRGKGLFVKFSIALLLLVTGLTLSTTMENAGYGGSKEETQFSISNQIFAFKLQKELAGGKTDNTFFSPFSISTALSMAYLGARKQTAQQMSEVLAFAELKTGIHDLYEKYLSVILEENNNFTLHVANRLFPNQKMKIEDDFVNLCVKHYKADVLALDFTQAAQSAKTINDWVREKTQDKIKDLVSPGVLSSNVFMVLVNAIYFKGNWASQFDKKHTNKVRFHINFSEEVAVDMMYQKRKFPYAYHPDYLCSVLEMPYKGESLSMVFVLPDTVDGLSNIENKMTPDLLKKFLHSLKNNSDVAVYIPKFKVEAKFELAPALSKLGMPDAFKQNADFSGMDKMNEVSISNVIHQAFVEVNEEGTEAAAATAVVMMKRSAARNPVFRADKPFLFFIMDRRTDIILFSGRLSRPEGEVISSSKDEL